MYLLLGVRSAAEATLAGNLGGRLAAHPSAVAVLTASSLLAASLVAAGVDRAGDGAHLEVALVEFGWID